MRFLTSLVLQYVIYRHESVNFYHGQTDKLETLVMLTASAATLSIYPTLPKSQIKHAEALCAT